MKESKILKFAARKLRGISDRDDAGRAMEIRREMGMLSVVREHSISENVSGIGLRPTDEMVGHDVEGESFSELLDSCTVEELEDWRSRKEAEFGRDIRDVDLKDPELGEDRRKNLRIARQEYERKAEIPDSVKEIVEGEEGLRQKWGRADDFSQVRDEFVEVVKAFRESSGNDYGEVMSIWEPNVGRRRIEEVMEEIKSEAMEILRELDPERVDEVWKDVEESIDTEAKLVDIADNPVGMHEYLANYVLGGNPVKMPVRIGGSGMEYGNSVMAPLQTVEDRFWAKAFDTTAHEFGHTYGRESLSSEHAFLPLGEPPTEAIDEGTARFYQNQVFRSKPFLTGFFGDSVREWFGKGSETPEFDDEQLYRWFNAIDPENRERVSASPIIYPLHIAVRYELERELIEGDEPVEKMVEDLEKRWQQKLQSYIGDPLGIEIDEMDDSKTVLQDVHWGKGKFGYFPTYTLGDVMAAKWREDIEQDIGGFEHRLREGELDPVDDWMVENIWGYGKAVWEESDHTRLETGPYKEYMGKTAKIYTD